MAVPILIVAFTWSHHINSIMDLKDEAKKVLSSMLEIYMDYPEMKQTRNFNQIEFCININKMM